MKNSNFLIVVACIFTLVGCQSHQLPKAKGKWVAVNEAGFIPHNVTKYSDSVSTLTQDTDSSIQEPTGAK